MDRDRNWKKIKQLRMGNLVLIFRLSKKNSIQNIKNKADINLN